eukprot:SAG22_NODE_841_length_6894_cov_3.024135_2_plen_481_part_00
MIDYLPQPDEVENIALNIDEDEAEVQLDHAKRGSQDFVGLAFKLEDGRFGQLTYVRVYQGSLKKGDTITNLSKGTKKVRVPRLIRMHGACVLEHQPLEASGSNWAQASQPPASASKPIECVVLHLSKTAADVPCFLRAADDKEEIDEIHSGEIAAFFGLDCNSGDTFTNGLPYALTSMFVPPAVVTLSIEMGKKGENTDKLSQALSRFQKEDPTFRVGYNEESEQTVISGMGELHLEIYVERLKREYGLTASTGAPQVNYRETITQDAEFDYLHKKQSGGSGQYGRVIGRLEVLPPDSPVKHEFVNNLVGNAIPPEYVAAIQKGFEDSVNKGPLTGSPIEGVRMIVSDGKSHDVDSSEMAFRTASTLAFKQGVQKAGGVLLEPIMNVSVQVPAEFQGNVVGEMNKRKGLITSTETANDVTVIEAEVPLGHMFGYANDIRSMTQGKGDFSMEYKAHTPVPSHMQEEIIEELNKAKAEREAK